MSDPLALLPYAVAARSGSIDGVPVAQLVAAGLTLLQRSAPLVRALSGRRSAILLPTGPAYFTALAASDGRGAVLINPLAAPSEIAHQIEDSGAGAVFTIAALASLLPPDMPHVLLDDSPRTARVLIGGTSTDVDLGSHAGLAIEGNADVPGRDEECAIVYTSAMAGRPLGAILTHRNLLANARQVGDAAGLSADEHSLALIPFSHCFGLTVTALAPLLAGGRVTTLARFNPTAVLDHVESGGVTLLVGVPAVFGAVLAAMARRGTGFRATALRMCLCGGAPLDPRLQDRWADATGLELRQGYGLTEASPVCLFNRLSHANLRGTLGVPLPGCEVTIRHPATGVELPQGAEGQICVRGETVFRGYVSGGEDGLQVRDEWLETGDRGMQNTDGTIRFLGLYKSMFTRNGFNIYPREIERAVDTMPGVRRVAVFAIPDELRENDIGLRIVGDVTDEKVRAWCAARLAAYKQPTVVEITPAG